MCNMFLKITNISTVRSVAPNSRQHIGHKCLSVFQKQPQQLLAFDILPHSYPFPPHVSVAALPFPSQLPPMGEFNKTFNINKICIRLQ